MKIITINTDASFSIQTGIGSFAYWIKGDGFHYKGGGVFKDKCKGSTHAEFQAVMNAIFIISKARKDFELLIINRDNISVNNSYNPRSKTRKNALSYELSMMLVQYRNSLSKEYGNKKRIVEFRHIKAHTGDLSEAKAYVNNWCDKKAKSELKKSLTTI